MRLYRFLAVLPVALLPLSSAQAQEKECPARQAESALLASSLASSSMSTFYYETEGDWIGGNAEEGFIIIELGNEGPIEFPLDAGFRLQADKRTRLRGVKDLRIDDLQRGDRVWVKFNSHDGRVVRLKLRRSPQS